MIITTEVVIRLSALSFARLAKSVPSNQIECVHGLCYEGNSRVFMLYVDSDADVSEPDLLAFDEVVAVDALGCASGKDAFQTTIQLDDVVSGAPAPERFTVTQAERTVVTPDGWYEKKLFQNYNASSRMRTHCEEYGVSIELILITQNPRGRDGSSQYELTERQQEALTLAISRGYYESPRQVPTEEPAEEMGISQPSMSSLLRRGERQFLILASGSQSQTNMVSRQRWTPVPCPDGRDPEPATVFKHPIPDSVETKSCDTQLKGETTMDIIEGCADPPVEGSKEYFTGDARLDSLLDPQSETRAAAASVTFEPDARTAWQALDAIDVDVGDRVLIHAAAGGVGHFVVQFAWERDLHVTGTASGLNKEYSRELGVDEFVNYREQRFEEVLEPADGAIDGVGGETFDRSLEILNEGSTIDKLPSPLTDEQQELVDEQGAEAIMTTVCWNGKWFKDITELLADGAASATPDTVLPLSEATEARRLSEAKHVRGKIILTPDDDESALD